jgi:hypothetical protein
VGRKINNFQYITNIEKEGNNEQYLSGIKTNNFKSTKRMRRNV